MNRVKCVRMDLITKLKFHFILYQNKQTVPRNKNQQLTIQIESKNP